MKKVFICSPYSGDIEKNTENAIFYCQQTIMEGHLPLAPHLYFPQMLDDDDTLERGVGCTFGLKWLSDSDEVRVFGSATQGMIDEIIWATKVGIPVHRYDKEGNRLEGVV